MTDKNTSYSRIREQILGILGQSSKQLQKYLIERRFLVDWHLNYFYDLALIYTQ